MVAGGTLVAGGIYIAARDAPGETWFNVWGNKTAGGVVIAGGAGLMITGLALNSRGSGKGKTSPSPYQPDQYRAFRAKQPWAPSSTALIDRLAHGRPALPSGVAAASNAAIGLHASPGTGQ